MARLATILFLALITLSAAVPTFDMVSPARQKQIKKLIVRRRYLQAQVTKADRNLQKLTRERHVAEVVLKTATRKLTTATEACQETGNCGHLMNMENAASVAQEKLNSVKKALSEAMEPETLARRKNQLADVSEELGMLSKILSPKPSVLARPLRE